MSKISKSGILYIFLYLAVYTMGDGDEELNHNGRPLTNVELVMADKSEPVMATATEMSIVMVPTGSPEEAKKCRKFMMVMVKRMMKVFNGCFQDFKKAYPEKEEFDKRFQCIIKCSMQKVHMLDENFKLSNATYSNFVAEHIPQEYHSLVYRTFGPCVMEYSAIITGKDDPLCLTYGNFMKCMQTVMSRAC